MADNLKLLVEAARRVRMTDAEQEKQRQSFAYGNTKIENDLITRETIARQSAKLKSEDQQ